jgi:hypothetical protein
MQFASRTEHHKDYRSCIRLHTDEEKRQIISRQLLIIRVTIRYSHNFTCSLLLVAAPKLAPPQTAMSSPLTYAPAFEAK